MEIQTNDWTYKEFLAFLLIYAASADFIIKDEEVEVICQKVGEESYKKIMKVYDKSNDYGHIQTILSYKEKYYPSEDEKQKILEDMKDVFMADDEFSSQEQLIFNAIKKIL